MGQRGPVPKRSTARAGRKAKADEPDQLKVAGAVEAPPADPKWGRAAKRYYQSLIDSGQAIYFEPTDWEQAQIIAILLTGQLKDSTLMETLLRETRKLIRELLKFQAEQDEGTRLYLLNRIDKVATLIGRLSSPPSAPMIKEIFKAMGDLGTTEGARRRMHIEVEREPEENEDEFELKIVQGGRSG